MELQQHASGRLPAPRRVYASALHKTRGDSDALTLGSKSLSAKRESTITFFQVKPKRPVRALKQPTAGPEPLPEAGAQRTLLALGSAAGLGGVLLRLAFLIEVRSQRSRGYTGAQTALHRGRGAVIAA